MREHSDAPTIRPHAFCNDLIIVQSLRVVLQSVADFVEVLGKQDQCDLNTAAIHMPLVAAFVSDPTKQVESNEMAAGLAALRRLAMKYCGDHPIRSRSMLVEMVYSVAGALLRCDHSVQNSIAISRKSTPSQCTDYELLAA